MSQNSVEILGQKFSYPQTWPGAVSIFFVCSCISFVAWTLEPEQIREYVGGFDPSQKAAQDKLVDLNEQLSKEVVALRGQVRTLTAESQIEESERNEILAQVTEYQEATIEKFEELVDAQEVVRQSISNELRTSNQQQQQALSDEQSRAVQQLGRFQQQQQQQQQQ